VISPDDCAGFSEPDLVLIDAPTRAFSLSQRLCTATLDTWWLILDSGLCFTTAFGGITPTSFCLSSSLFYVLHSRTDDSSFRVLPGRGYNFFPPPRSFSPLAVRASSPSSCREIDSLGVLHGWGSRCFLPQAGFFFNTQQTIMRRGLSSFASLTLIGFRFYKMVSS